MGPRWAHHPPGRVRRGQGGRPGPPSPRAQSAPRCRAGLRPLAAAHLRLVGPGYAAHGSGGSAFPRPCLSHPWRRRRRSGARALTTPLPAITRGLPGAPHTAPPTQAWGWRVRLTPTPRTPSQVGPLPPERAFLLRCQEATFALQGHRIRWEPSMKRVGVVYVFALWMVVGCGPDPAPRMQTFQTEQGRANARACLQAYDNCTLPCYDMRSNSCVQRCNNTLADCYATAE